MATSITTHRDRAVQRLRENARQISLHATADEQARLDLVRDLFLQGNLPLRDAELLVSDLRRDQNRRRAA